MSDQCGRRSDDKSRWKYRRKLSVDRSYRGHRYAENFSVQDFSVNVVGWRETRRTHDRNYGAMQSAGLDVQNRLCVGPRVGLALYCLGNGAHNRRTSGKVLRVYFTARIKYILDCLNMSDLIRPR